MAIDDISEISRTMSIFSTITETPTKQASAIFSKVASGVAGLSSKLINEESKEFT